MTLGQRIGAVGPEDAVAGPFCFTVDPMPLDAQLGSRKDLAARIIYRVWL